SFEGQSTANTTGVTWTFGDGSSMSFGSASEPGALRVKHAYEHSGAYTITLTVQFQGGGSLTTSMQISIRGNHDDGDDDQSDATAQEGVEEGRADPFTVHAEDWNVPGGTQNPPNIVDGAIAALEGDWFSDNARSAASGATRHLRKAWT